MTMKKHGAEAHFVRPDGVYRTSVLQAIPGYQPVSNAYEVAARFTTGPYFAMQLNGNGLSPLQKLRFKFQSWVDRARARRAMAMMQQVAATAVPTQKPAGVDVAALPTAAASSPISIDYGVGPAREGMAKVGAQITAGLIQSGDQALPAPPMAQTEFDRAGQIDPTMAMVPGQMAAMVQMPGVPMFVGDRAAAAALARWNGLRNWWWWNQT